MPVLLIERMPLPSLRSYSAFSILLVALAVYFAHTTVTSFTEETSGSGHGLSDDNETLAEITAQTHKMDHQLSENESNLSVEEYFMEFSAVILQEPWCVWVIVNMAYCCLIVYGKLIQKVVFGKLRVSEQQHLQDKFWNFIFYKFIFIFGVMNVQTMEEVVLWCAWFTVLGFLHLLSQLSKDRFEYLCSSPSTPVIAHAKLLTLLVSIALCCVLLILVCVGTGFFFSGINTFAFMAAECILLLLKTVQVLIKYGIQLRDETRPGVWENRAVYVYYTELLFELAVLSVDFVHHLHMLLWGNILLSMASLVICMQLRFLFHEIQRRIRRHKNYKRVIKHMQDKFPMATLEELQAMDDPCAICWEEMQNARKLPCSHYFHNSCLRSWLEQDATCPTCRQSIGDSPLAQERTAAAEPGPAGDAAAAEAAAPAQQAQQLRNHFFHFDGSRYVSWLPSFSVEVRHSHLFGIHGRMRPLSNSQFDNMARQVREVFPDVPLEIIQADLQRTRSVELTIDNLIEGSVEGNMTMPHPNADDDIRQETAPNATAPPAHLYQPTAAEAAPFTAQTSNSSATSAIYMQRTAEDADDEPSLSAALGISNFTSGPGYWDGLVSGEISGEEDASDAPPPGGSRFSKSARERQLILQERRKKLVEQAKKQYINKKKSVEGTSVDGPADSVVEDVAGPAVAAQGHSAARRELLYEATRRRLHHT